MFEWIEPGSIKLVTHTPQRNLVKSKSRKLVNETFRGVLFRVYVQLCFRADKKNKSTSSDDLRTRESHCRGLCHVIGL